MRTIQMVRRSPHCQMVAVVVALREREAVGCDEQQQRIRRWFCPETMTAVVGFVVSQP